MRSIDYKVTITETGVPYGHLANIPSSAALDDFLTLYEIMVPTPAPKSYEHK